MQAVYVATKNTHKVNEFRQLFKALPVVVKALPEEVPECPENGTTFAANAMQKASFYGAYCDGWVVADDSGLCVDALSGRPGVHSARYAGEHGNDQANNEKLLRELADVPDTERTAHFVCCLALWHQVLGVGLVVEGRVDGRIGHKPMGDHGFGYDPLFIVPSLGLTMGQLPAEQKNMLSHRALAVESLLHIWQGGNTFAPVYP